MSGFLHTELLAALKEKVRERQERHRNHMAKGLPESDYRVAVGQHKECAHLIDEIEAIEKDQKGVNDEDDGKGTGR